MSNTRLSCPYCGKGDRLATIELLQALSYLDSVTTDSVSYNGESRMIDETMTTIGISCRDCGWEHVGIDWREHLRSN